MKEALEAVYHLQPCDPGIIQGCSVRVYNDGFSQLHIFEVDEHRLQRSCAEKVWSGSEGPQEPPCSRLITNETQSFTICWSCLCFRGSLGEPKSVWLNRGQYWLLQVCVVVVGCYRDWSFPVDVATALW